MKVFLGGTVNKSTWRKYIMPKLKIDYFNPVVDDWNEEAYQNELYERRHCDYCLYVITPKLLGFYALCEAVDDSFKRPDRTIFCFLKEDEDDIFDEHKLLALNRIAKTIEDNGGIWKKTLNDVINFLNSSNGFDPDTIFDPEKVNDAFISYGRKHSKKFTANLYNKLKEKGKRIWVDLNDVPVGIGFLSQVNERIRQSHTFIFVISPHSIRSEYCLRELELALELRKKIIVLVHVEPNNEWNNMNKEIENFRWIYFKENINDFDESFITLLETLDSDKDYIKKHTRFLNKAYRWNNKNKNTDLLLYGNERTEADKWLKLKFENKQRPTKISELHKDYITESKKLEFTTRMAFWLHKKVAFITDHKKFDTIVGFISLANPLSMLPQLFLLIVAIKVEGVSVGMWYLFVAIQFAFTLVAIKAKNMGMFVSMFLSILISMSIIILTTIKS